MAEARVLGDSRDNVNFRGGVVLRFCDSEFPSSASLAARFHLLWQQG
jgi:hypothetical protein